MKNLICVLMITLFATSSFAMEFSSTLLPVRNASVTVNYGPRYAAVQPTAHLNFNFSSCSRYHFQAEVTVGENNVHYVELKIPMAQRDCMGPIMPRSYSIQLSSDYSGENYVLLNPLAIEGRLPGISIM